MWEPIVFMVCFTVGFVVAKIVNHRERMAQIKQGVDPHAREAEADAAYWRDADS